MKKNLLFILLCMVVSATVSAQQTTPPILNLNEADHERLFGMVQALDAEQQAGTTESVGYSDQESPVVARDFVQQYLVLERKLTTDYFVSDYCGPHAIYYYPTNISAAAVWTFPAKSKKEAPIAGQSLYSLSAVGHEGVFVISDWGKQKMKSKSVASERRVPSAGQTAGQLLEGGSSQNLYNSLIAVNCTPLPVAMHFDDNKAAHIGVADVVSTLRLTDARERYLLDGYDITLTCLTPDLLELCYTDIRTDSAGIARIFASGLKEGTARIRATIDYSDPDRNSRLFCEKEFTVEVKKKSGLHVEATLHDASRAVAVDFHISFDVRYSSECGTDSVTVEAGKATITSAGGTEEVPCGGGMAQGLFRLCFVTDGTMVYSSYAAVRSEVLGAFRKGFGALLRSSLTGQMPPNSTVPMYNTPTEIQFPGTPGVYSYHITARGMMDAGEAGNKTVLVNKTMVMPALKKILSCTEDITYFSAVGNGGGPYWSGTITVTEIEE